MNNTSRHPTYNDITNFKQNSPFKWNLKIFMQKRPLIMRSLLLVASSHKVIY